MSLSVSCCRRFFLEIGLLGIGLGLWGGLYADTPGISEFFPGSLRSWRDLPDGSFRQRLERLPERHRQRALSWLRDFHFTRNDLGALRVDAEGGIYFADHFNLGYSLMEVNPDQSEAVETADSVPIDPYPSTLIFHSRPGSANILYLNFCGELVTNTAWNDVLQRTNIPAVGFSLDSDYSTFNLAEQLAVKRIWERVSEDYAPFDIDVTTERPVEWGRRIAHALITRKADANGELNSESSAGGIAYVNMFGAPNYAFYRPAWIYYDNLASKEAYIGEAVSHEIGHNMGLSHDGRTDGVEYYKGHGSGENSWGPIMGSSWGRQLSQWSKGEYYLANNMQDDLAIISGKLTRRLDDHGNTFSSATPLVITQGTNILSTTPEDDPTNSQPWNKGVIEGSDDIDVFSLITGAGEIDITINPLLISSGTTHGGNLDIVADLCDHTGQLLLTADDSHLTSAHIRTNLLEGLYYLRVRNTGLGNPTNSLPSGYTSYGSIGQYFITGRVVKTDYVSPPQAVLKIADVTMPGNETCLFTITYTDDRGIDTRSLDDQDIRVTGPLGFNTGARLVSVSPATNGTGRAATYAINLPAEEPGVKTGPRDYQVWMQPGQVTDLEGASVPDGFLGQFTVRWLRSIYANTLDIDPGWQLDPLWQFGAPAYRKGGPSSGYTGTYILAYNLSGNYENQLPAKYATMPPLDCSRASFLVLRFRRWLQLRSGDTATIQVSTNGVSWTNLWSTTQTVSDSAWQEVSYSLPPWADQSPSLQLRWGIASGPTMNDIGWNLDDIEILAGSITPDVPPTARLAVSVNQSLWGTVNPSSGSFPPGSVVEIAATPAPHFRFVEWTGAVCGASNPVTLVLNTNVQMQAVFAEVLTTNHPTPCWWLAVHGYTQNLESAVETLGANRLPLWQSYIAGLNPDDPDSQLRLQVSHAGTNADWILHWNTVTGRVYSLLWSSNLLIGFTLVSNAARLPSSVQVFTNSLPSSYPNLIYRLEVEKP